MNYYYILIYLNEIGHLDTFSSNPQYYITLVDTDDSGNKDMCTAIIALMLKGTRLKHKQRSLSFGFYIYNVSRY